jgi:tetratricopeptide (TPR) repeat protein
MLGVVREYARHRLESRGEAEAARRNHAAYFLALAEDVEPHLQGWRPAKWLDSLEQEHDNLRAALRWSLAHDVGTAARLAAAIRYFWNFQGHLTEGLQWSESILKLGDNVPTITRWKILSMAGNLARFQGNYETARMMYEQGLSEGREADDLPQISLSCRGLGGLALEQGNYNAAREFIEEALAVARESNDKFGVARSLNMLGDLARTVGDDAAARPLFEEALAICRQLGNQYAIGNILNNLAAAEYGEGDYTAAYSHFAEGLTMAQELGDKIVGDKIAISYALDGFGALAASRGESELATNLAGAAEQLRQSINYNIEPAERRFRDTYLASTRVVLSEAVFSAAYAKGRRLKLDEAVALAMGKKTS